MIRKITRIIHRWLGITSGLVVFVIAFTGAMIVFEPEISKVTDNYRHAPEKNRKKLDPSFFLSAANEVYPDKDIYNVTYQEDRSVEVMFYNEDQHYQYNVFFDPYSGELLHKQNTGKTFFGFMLTGHTTLWLPSQTGMWIARSATLIFILIAITGFINWYPRNGNTFSRFKIKWKSSWRRRNYDLHAVTAFYIMWVGLFLAVTGSVMGFAWFEESYFKLWSLGKHYSPYEIPVSQEKSRTNSLYQNIDALYNQLKKQFPDCRKFELVVPVNDEDAIEAWSNRSLTTHGDADIIYYDQNTLTEIPVQHPWRRQSELTFAQKVRRTNIDLHLGNYFGVWGKIVLFVSSLFLSTLPVTGFWIWYGRKFKPTKRQPNNSKELTEAFK